VGRTLKQRMFQGSISWADKENRHGSKEAKPAAAAEWDRKNRLMIARNAAARELENDAEIRKAAPFSDRWWKLVKRADELRTELLHLGFSKAIPAAVVRGGSGG